MIKVEHSVVINRPVPEVFAFVTDPPIEFTVTILFPWDNKQRLFTGERVYFYLK